MPEHLRALIFILILSAIVLVGCKKAICAVGMQPADFDRRRNAWLAVTVLGFLSPNFWIAMGVLLAVAWQARRSERNPAALYVLLMTAVPIVGVELPGLGPIRYFFEVNGARLLSAVLLLPVALKLFESRSAARLGSLAADKLILASLALNFVLVVPASTLFGLLRVGLLHPVLDVLLVYFAISRTLVTRAKLEDFIATYIMAALLLAALAVFEWRRGWLLYNALNNAWGVAWNFGGYLARGDGLLRAQGTSGHPIALGLFMAVSIPLLLGRWAALERRDRTVLLAGLALGLVAPVSRGPWVGAAAAVLVFVALGEHSARRLATLLVASVGGGALAAALPIGRKLLDYLPFVGTVDEGGVLYRQQVWDVSLSVIARNPLFGSNEFLLAPEMQQLMQGEGIIDIVNQYVGVALSGGLVMLALFVGLFAAAASALYRGMRRQPGRGTPGYAVGQALLAALAGIVVTLGTVSNVTTISYLYHVVIAAAVGYGIGASPPQRTRRSIGSDSTVSQAF